MRLRLTVYEPRGTGPLPRIRIGHAEEEGAVAFDHDCVLSGGELAADPLFAGVPADSRRGSGRF